MKKKMPVFQNPELDGKTFYWPGNSSGILLLHGFTATTTEVRLLANEFRRLGFTISAPLLPGHGTTPQDLNTRKYKDWLTCVEGAYAELKKTCTRVVVGGESMGAVLSLYLAEHHPEISALLLYSPAIRVESLKLSPVIKTFVPIIEKANNDPEDKTWQGYTVYPMKAANEFRKLQKLVIHQLEAIHQPALILQGLKDKTIDKQSGSMILKSIHSEYKSLQCLSDSGHVMLLGSELQLITHTSVQFLKSLDIL
ncbi:alpha/beta hydrolase [Pelolinea submarina]|uniref:Carboxylesterase n=1 Tax=Pelolinea submarina TaxID=913107 RepID=A0A347ZT93_9CHLR|nr:alpha/beta fold hydrolase [Pelolinea submarina]REG10901.1 carboxylesterase [Pelolinea submarina]BBB48524.1 carboxylesterase [Pelolinea submarina]